MTNAEVVESASRFFGKSGLRLTVFREGGYVLNRFADDIRGEQGDTCALVGYPPSGWDMEDTIRRVLARGTLVVDNREKRGYAIHLEDRFVGNVMAADEDCALFLARQEGLVLRLKGCKAVPVSREQLASAESSVQS